MAVCNLFSDLNNASGNFMMFSQYVEDITRNYSDGDNWKIVPTQFVALDVDYSNLKGKFVNTSNLNVDIPKYFQNYFENACAYSRNVNTDIWNSSLSRNLFWNAMFDGGFTTITTSENASIVPEIVYYGDINMHSYNEHQGMGYGEIYCYIPTDAGKMKCQVVSSGNRGTEINTNNYLEGFYNVAGYEIGDYSKEYLYGDDFKMPFDDSGIGKLMDYTNVTKYNINTIVVMYSVFRKLNDEWDIVYQNIPMGMYIAGTFDGSKISNPITKYVSTSNSTGTSYGLRICTRLSSTSNGKIVNTDIVTDDSGYTNVCQLMTAMNENLSRMMDISKSALDTTQQYKDLLAMVKNNRINVPYIKNVNGVDCWFVNGRFIAYVSSSINIPECDHECNISINDYAATDNMVDNILGIG